MKQVQRSELLDLGAYEQIRPQFRARVIELKARRRLALGEHMSIVFENHDTVLLQIQEMLRAERITDERGIAHELETYNALVPASGALSATLFVEYDDKDERARMLERLATLRTCVHLDIAGRRATARFSAQFGEDAGRLPAVNYLAFEVGDVSTRLRDATTPVALVIDHPAYAVRTTLPPSLREELARDLEP